MELSIAIFNYSLPLIWIVTAMEYFWWRKRRPERPYPWRQVALTLLAWPVVVLLYGLEATYVSTPYYEWVRSHRLFDVSMANPLSWAAAFIINELVYYATHRLSHGVAWIWANHSVHHEPPALILPSAYQFPWLNVLGGLWLLSFPLHLLGFPPDAVAVVAGVNLAYAYFVQTEMVPALGFLEGIFNTPAAHRVHHSRRPEDRDRNFGSMLVVFDRLFGTFKPEDPAHPCTDFGLDAPLARRTLLATQLHGWARLARPQGRQPSPDRADELAG
jgi:sterol desaturase/sphingolipid hydroxylase (fatty acid hydroxylase superfamily)